MLDQEEGVLFLLLIHFSTLASHVSLARILVLYLLVTDSKTGRSYKESLMTMNPVTLTLKPE